jgi:hypothetical protein
MRTDDAERPSLDIATESSAKLSVSLCSSTQTDRVRQRHPRDAGSSIVPESSVFENSVTLILAHTMNKPDMKSIRPSVSSFFKTFPLSSCSISRSLLNHTGQIVPQ